MTYRIRFRSIATEGRRYVTHLDVRSASGRESLREVEVRVPVEPAFAAVAQGQPGVDAVALTGIVARAIGIWSLPRIEAAVRDGSLMPVAEIPDGVRVVTMGVPGDELEALTRDAEVKRCRYQVAAGGDLFCDCGWASPAFRERLETSAHLCRNCTLPDARVICSHLHHAKVTRQESTDECSIVALTGDCDLGYTQRANDPAKCCFGGHQCWERVVETDARSEVVQFSPLTLHEAIGYLDAVWRNAFGDGLLGRDVLLAGGTLATPCTGIEDFQDKVSALVLVFNAFRVPVDSKDGSLAKMLAHLQGWAAERGAPPEEVAPVEQAISVLRRATRLRAGFEHGTGGDFEEAQQVLGLRLPAVSYAEEWTRLVARVAGQLAIVREFLRTHAQQAPNTPVASPRVRRI